jgi:hypothetical protein
VEQRSPKIGATSVCNLQKKLPNLVTLLLVTVLLLPFSNPFFASGENYENFVVRMSNLLHLFSANLALSPSKVFKAAESTMARHCFFL